MKKQSTSDCDNELIQSEDVLYEEQNGLCELPLAGKPIAQFSFHDNSVPTNEPMLKDIVDNRSLRTQLNGITPPVDGEYFDIRRSFSFRRSTVRKLNELKSNHEDINIYLNELVDKAICHYYEYVFKT